MPQSIETTPPSSPRGRAGKFKSDIYLSNGLFLAGLFINLLNSLPPPLPEIDSDKKLLNTQQLIPRSSTGAVGLVFQLTDVFKMRENHFRP